MGNIEERLEAVHQQIHSAAARSGRAPNEITLVAVSKKNPPDTVRRAFDAGQRVFGESKVQEALPKIPLLPGSISWHFIGHLQTNKIRKALPLFDLFHSVDSVELAIAINRVGEEMGLFPKVLLEVNVAGEASKFGFSPDLLRKSLDELLSLSRVQVEGLMTIAPIAREAEESRPHFVALRGLKEELSQRAGIPLPILSMGMSGDFPIAIEEGASHVRVGTAIFGERQV